MNLKQYVDPVFWFEKEVKYRIENRIKPSAGAKAKAVGSTLAQVGICIGGLTLPFTYLVSKIPSIKEELPGKVEQYLLEKGYTQEQISKALGD